VATVDGDQFDSFIASEGVPRLLTGLALLWQAHQSCDVRDATDPQVAVAGSVLRAAGLTTPDIQLLLDKGLARFAEGATPRPSKSRSASLSHGSPEKAGLVLTHHGEALVKRLFKTVGEFHSGDRGVRRRVDHRAHVLLKPRWDPENRELRLGRVVVKRFRNAAPNQECLLDAFERAGWPDDIEDPLPHESQAVERLRETVVRLNRSLQQPLIKFERDRTGRRVQWRYLGPQQSMPPNGSWHLLVG
jgi:hypothetical protein